MTVGYDLDKLKAIQAIAHNTKVIAEQLQKLNTILVEISENSAEWNR